MASVFNALSSVYCSASGMVAQGINNLYSSTVKKEEQDIEATVAVLAFAILGANSKEYKGAKLGCNKNIVYITKDAIINEKNQGQQRADLGLSRDDLLYFRAPIKRALKNWENIPEAKELFTFAKAGALELETMYLNDRAVLGLDLFARLFEDGEKNSIRAAAEREVGSGLASASSQAFSDLQSFWQVSELTAAITQLRSGCIETVIMLLNEKQRHYINSKLNEVKRVEETTGSTNSNKSV